MTTTTKPQMTPLAAQSPLRRGVITLALLVALPSGADAAPVDLSTWTAESYPAVAGFPPGDWQVAPGGASVLQEENGQPTLFYSDFSARNTDVNGTIEVVTSSDDDVVGFVLGFDPGDSTSATADYLLVDWKQNTQSFNFSGPPDANATPGSTSEEGLAVSRVTGIPTADELWGHEDFPENPDGGVTELARATNLGNSGWDDQTAYDFRFVYTQTRLKIYVNDVLEIDVAGTFPDGRLGFYNFSQGDVSYSAFESVAIPSVPEPAALSGLFGLGALLLARRRACPCTRRTDPLGSFKRSL